MALRVRAVIAKAANAIGALAPIAEQVTVNAATVIALAVKLANAAPLPLTLRQKVPVVDLAVAAIRSFRGSNL